MLNGAYDKDWVSGERAFSAELLNFIDDCGDKDRERRVSSVTAALST